MTKPKTTQTPLGPTQSLVSRIDHLASLLRNLPSTIPLDPPELRYHFVLNYEKIEGRGMFGAAPRMLKLPHLFPNFGMHPSLGLCVCMIL